jgi:hypothetical protein
MRALFHITVVVPFAVIALLSFLIILAIKAIQDVVAFRPIIAAAYAKKVQYPQWLAFDKDQPLECHFYFIDAALAPAFDSHRYRNRRSSVTKSCLTTRINSMGVSWFPVAINAICGTWNRAITG